MLANGEQTLADFFSLADNIGAGKLKRAILDMIGYHGETVGQTHGQTRQTGVESVVSAGASADPHRMHAQEDDASAILPTYDTYYVASWGGCRSKMVVDWLKHASPMARVHHIHDPHPPTRLTFPNGEKFGNATFTVPRDQRGRSVVLFLTRLVVFAFLLLSSFYLLLSSFYLLLSSFPFNIVSERQLMMCVE